MFHCSTVYCSGIIHTKLCAFWPEASCVLNTYIYINIYLFIHVFIWFKQPILCRYCFSFIIHFSYTTKFASHAARSGSRSKYEQILQKGVYLKKYSSVNGRLQDPPGSQAAPLTPAHQDDIQAQFKLNLKWQILLGYKLQYVFVTLAVMWSKLGLGFHILIRFIRCCLFLCSSLTMQLQC